jgi:hypothetical protein
VVPVALFCEGPTDHAVLSKLLEGYSADRVSLNRVFPPDPMRRGVDFGGWMELFKAIARREISAALLFNDLVILQVDTDVCHEPGFDVLRVEAGRKLSESELVERVAERLRQEIEAHDPDADLGRVVFAISVSALECWLLLHLSAGAKTNSCLFLAEQAIAKKGGEPLSDKRGKTDKRVKKLPRAYEAAAHGLRRRPAVDALRNRAPSLDAFLGALDTKLAPLLA